MYLRNLHQKMTFHLLSLELEYNVSDFIAETLISKQTPWGVHNGGERTQSPKSVCLLNSQATFSDVFILPSQN